MSRLAFRRKFIATSISTAVSLGIAACLITPPALYAQTDVAQLHGTVVDATGAILAGAKVHVVNTATGFERDTASNGAGDYNFPSLPTGSYAETVSASGFGNFDTTITLTIGATATIDAKLGVNATQAVSVDAGDSDVQVNTTNQETSTVIGGKELQNLPSLTRNPYDFVSLSTGVSADTNGSTSGEGVGVSMNGGRSASTEILLDGVDNVDTYAATAGQTIPMDSVQEYSVITNGFDAQYGRASGGVLNLGTIAGTNRFHGSVYEYNRVSALAANTYNEDAQDYALRAQGLPNNPRDHFTRNQFGFAVGGPILHDKLFFFTNYEWNRIRSTGAQEFEVPSAAFLASANPATQSFFNSYGTTLTPGTVVGNTVPVAGFANNPLQLVTVNTSIDAGAGSPVNAFFGDSRFDYNPTDRLSMFFRGATYNDAYPAGYVSLSPFNGYSTGQNDFDQSYLYSVSYVITPNLITTSKVSFGREMEQEPLGPAGVTPTLYLNQANVASVDTNTGIPIAFPGYLPLSPGGAIPFGGPQNTYQFLEELSYTHGKHTFKVGGEFIQIRDNRTFGAYDNAVEQVAKNGTTLAASLAQMQLGNIYSAEVALNAQGELPCAYNEAGTLNQTSACSINTPASSPSFTRENTYNDGNWYFQDQWKINNRLTLNAGIRWEYYGVQHNHNPSLDSNFFLGTGSTFAEQIATGQVLTSPNSPVGGLIQKQLNNYAPRIGFAFDPKGDGKWAIRGGYGINYERDFGNVTYNVIQNPPNYAVVSEQSTANQQYSISTNNLLSFAGNSGSQPLAPSELRALQQNMPTAYAHQYSLTVEHEVAANDLLSVFYSGSRGVHQYAIANFNGEGYGTFIGNPNGLNTANPSYYADRLNPQYTAINMREANGNSYYDSLNAQLKANNFSRYGVQAIVSYTYAHSLDNLSSTFSESGNNFNLGYLNPFNPRLDHGNSDYDTRHRLSIGGVYEPTFLEFRQNRLIHQTVGGLQFDPILTLRSGTPFTIYDCTNSLNGCPRIDNAPGLQFHGTPTPNGGVNSFNYIAIPQAAHNTFVNSQGFSDFPDTLGGYQDPGIERNQFFAPKNFTLDMGVHKDFKFGESDRYVAQVRGEFYDILNHHNYYPVVGSADFAEVTNVTVAKGASYAGEPSASDERRNVQLALRLSF